MGEGEAGRQSGGSTHSFAVKHNAPLQGKDFMS